MKIEAADFGAGFAVSMIEKVVLSVGPTENAGIVSKQGELVIPRFSCTGSRHGRTLI